MALNGELDLDGIYVDAVTRGYQTQQVIQDLSLAALPGKVYVLLGSGGSGKSTLLRVVTGYLEPEKGRVLVGGRPLGSRRHAVPGPLIGYMPQKIGLFADLSIMENLVYFGGLNSMSRQEVEEHYGKLASLLTLPSASHIVGHLSRGLQQMVSFACAIQHAPRIIVLDEPVAGLDLLRAQTVWSVLLQRAHEDNVTVLVSSHAIDDSRHADVVGFMRGGRLLAEGAPLALCEQYGCDRLEAVFTSLCLQTDRVFLPIVRKIPTSSRVAPSSEEFAMFEEASTSGDDEGDALIPQDQFGSHEGLALEASVPSHQRPRLSDSGNRIISTSSSAALRHSGDRHLRYMQRFHAPGYRWKQTKAVMWRQLATLRRSWILVFFQLVIPTVQALLFLLFIGNAPQYLPVAVVNYDTSGPVGKKLADFINVSDALETSFYPNHTIAVDAIQNGFALAAFVIPQNFSSNFYAFMQNPVLGHFDKNVSLVLDFGDYQVTEVIINKLRLSIAELVNYYYGNVSLTLFDAIPIYGQEDTQFIRFIAPGYLAYTSFCFAMFVSVFHFFWERRNACLERAFSSGLRPSVIICSNIILFWFLIAIQAVFMLFLTVVTFRLDVVGNVGLLLLVLWLVSSAGVTFGLLLSVLCRRESIAIQVAVAVSFLKLSLCGILWPLLSVTKYVSWISYSLPVTWASYAFRDIYTRGWGMEHMNVWMSLVISLTWNILAAILLLLIVRPRKTLWQCWIVKRAPLQD